VVNELDEAKRFFRFVLPGLAVTLEVGLFIALLHPSAVIPFLREHLGKDATIGTGVTIFVASGGLGFILSNIYHFISWSVFRGVITVNHKRLIEHSVRANTLRLTELESGEKVNRISRRAAWQVATAIWYSRLGCSQRLKGASGRTDSLTSIVHSIGTLTVGTFIVSICVFSYAFFTLQIAMWDKWLLVGLIVFLPVSQAAAYKVAVHHAQRVIDQILYEELRFSRSLGRSLEWYGQLRKVSVRGWTWWG
jgi:hypothetical protein